MKLRDKLLVGVIWLVLTGTTILVLGAAAGLGCRALTALLGDDQEVAQ